MASSQSINILRLTESGLARDLGVSRQAIHDLVKRGILIKDKTGKIDAEMAKIALANRLHPSSKTSAALHADDAEKTAQPADKTQKDDDELQTTSYHVAKTLREAAEAQMARLKLAEMQGNLIRVDAVKAAMAFAMSTTRDALLQIPARIGPLLAAESDTAKVQNLLHAEIHQALLDLAGASDRV
jgi:phage terminase Nu1 subunit (DNA packaging protein)